MAYVGFDKLKGEIAAKSGVRNPGAVAAAIGRRKYGAKAMGHASALGRMKGHGAAASYMKGLMGGGEERGERPGAKDEKE